MTTTTLLVGEAQGENEARIGMGFVGASGLMLLRMLHDADVITLTARDRNLIDAYYKRNDPRQLDAIWRTHPELVRTNVFQQHPPGNQLAYFCGERGFGIPSYGSLLPRKYVRNEFAFELDRLADEVLALNPNLIVCLGNSAVWAFTGKTGVSKLRGTTVLSTHCVSGCKLLVTYHPSAVLRQPELRPTTIMDLSKIVKEREFPEVRRPPCEIWIEPDVDDVETFFKTHLRSGQQVAVDIETVGTRITCIGFAPRSDLAIVIPFDDERKAGKSYWPTIVVERYVWGLIRTVLEDGTILKTFQNGLYDIAFLIRSYGIRTRGANHDTMLLHHALQPEALKSLGYLGSLYTDHGPWKSERKHTDTIKRDE